MVRKQRILARGLRHNNFELPLCPIRRQKTANPRQGIKTHTKKPFRYSKFPQKVRKQRILARGLRHSQGRRHRLDGLGMVRKQRILARGLRLCVGRRLTCCSLFRQKTANPRQGIKTRCVPTASAAKCGRRVRKQRILARGLRR